MTRIALYLVCATGLAVIGTRAFQLSTDIAYGQGPVDADRAEAEWCEDSAAHRPDVPPKIEDPAEDGEEKSAIVKALLKVLDEFDGDDDDNTNESRDLLRRVLREADPELARSLGTNSLRLIAEANCKPKHLALFLHCDDDDRVGKFPDRNVPNDEEVGPHDARFENPECEDIRPLREGTVENPIPPKNDPRTNQEGRPDPAPQPNDDDPAGEDPFGVE